MSQLKGYLLYAPEDAKKNTAFINMFLKEASMRGISLSLLLTTDKCLHKAEADFIINRSRLPALSKALEQRGIRVFNDSNVCEICNDKQLTYDSLKSHQIPFMDFCWLKEMRTNKNPQTENHLFYSGYIKKARQFGYPFVIKPAGGHGGAHVSLIENEEHLYYSLKSVSKDYGYLPKLLFQRCASDIGKDLRVYVLGGKIVAGMMRTRTDHASDSEIRANFCLGAAASLHTLTKEETALTVQISAALPADLVGIDFVYHNGHAIFNEIEDAVGTRMLYQYTDIDIVKEYMDYIIKTLSAS